MHLLWVWCRMFSGIHMCGMYLLHLLHVACLGCVCVYVHMYICIYHGSDTNLCLSVLVPRGPEARLAGAKD